jgi:hypothetical protein
MSLSFGGRPDNGHSEALLSVTQKREAMHF